MDLHKSKFYVGLCAVACMLIGLVGIMVEVLPLAPFFPLGLALFGIADLVLRLGASKSWSTVYAVVDKIEGYDPPTAHFSYTVAGHSHRGEISEEGVPDVGGSLKILIDPDDPSSFVSSSSMHTAFSVIFAFIGGIFAVMLLIKLR